MLPPAQVAALLWGFAPPWCVAGGWAVDLYLGRVTRAHADVECAVLRRDQFALRAHLRDWRWQKVVGGALVDWPRGEWVELPIHELYATDERAEPPRLEVLLNEARGDAWVFRRDARVTRPLAACVRKTTAGLPFLSPELVLLYKSKAPRAKDEEDFAAVVTQLEAEPRAWLRAALATCAPDHHWLRRL
ncbi:MAG TPA: hypothetical protein VF546_04705 [Pyrinomonadaceae bacterium]|jgi:hypothetical protein